MENIGINLLHFEIIKIKIDTKIYLNYYYHSQSKSKQVKASQSKSKQVTEQPIKLQKSFRVLSRNSFRRMSVAVAAAQTIGMAFKEYMKNISDEISTSKDLDEHFAQFKKDFKEKKKNIKIEIAEKKKDDKKKKRNNLDEDGNEKPKRPLTKYQQYIRDNQQRIRDEFPELSNTERFSKLAEEWKAYKATLVKADDDEDEEETDYVVIEPEEPEEPVTEAVDEVVVEEDEKAENAEKAKKAKKAKKAVTTDKKKKDEDSE